MGTLQEPSTCYMCSELQTPRLQVAQTMCCAAPPNLQINILAWCHTGTPLVFYKEAASPATYLQHVLETVV